MKDILFMLFGYVGMVIILLLLIMLVFYLFNKITNATKYVIMYLQYKRDKDVYNIRNNLIVSKSGKIEYSCFGDLDKQLETLNKAIKHIEELKQLKEDISKK